MKVRSCFVSNSSSSSFIMGCGIVINEDALDKYVKEHNITDLEVESVKNLLSGEYSSWSANVSEYRLSVESFTYDEVSVVIENLDPDTKIAFFYEIGPHDDSDFYDEDGEYCDYDIDLEGDFNKDQEAMAELMYDTDIIKDGEVSMGAGRNG